MYEKGCVVKFQKQGLSHISVVNLDLETYQVPRRNHGRITELIMFVDSR